MSLEINRHIDEKTLWLQFREGSRQSFDQILQSYYEVLLKYGIRMLGTQFTELVEDSLQDFFVDLWSSKERLGDAVSLKAYLISSFKRRLLREKGRKSKTVTDSDLVENYEFEVQFNVEKEIIEQELSEENSKKIKLLLEQLSKRQQEAIFLRFFEKMSYDDIALVMNINKHSAVNLIYGGVKLLRAGWFESIVLLTCLIMDYLK